MDGWDRSADAVQTSFQLLPLHLLIRSCLFLPLRPALGRRTPTTPACPANLLLPPQPPLSCGSWPWFVPGKSTGASFQVPHLPVSHAGQRRKGLQSLSIVFGSRVLVLQLAEKVQNGCKLCTAAALCDGRAYPLLMAALYFNSNRRKSPHWLERGGFECAGFSPLSPS